MYFSGVQLRLSESGRSNPSSYAETTATMYHGDTSRALDVQSSVFVCIIESE
jgi:hypothetical protein